MKLKDIMSKSVVKIHAQESVEVAARLLTHYNIGLLPVCDNAGRVLGVVTDRDLVTRCLASNRSPGETKVREVMTNRVVTASGEMETGVAAHLMAREQIRRLPVVEGERLLGMVSVGDLACREEGGYDAAEALEGICANINYKELNP